MIRVFLESPYTGDVAENVKYAHRCIADCIMRDEAPFASHILFTTSLDDSKPEERALGIAAGSAWRAVSERCVVYVDRGISPGMIAGIRASVKLGHFVEIRAFDGDVDVVGLQKRIRE